MDILYIEDDIIDQIALRRVLKHHHAIDCKVANDLEEAEKLIQRFTFDLILSDYYLAGDTIEDVMSKFGTLPIFLLSGSEKVQKIDELYQKGLKGHFHKPFSKKDLSMIINQEKTVIKVNNCTFKADFSQPISFDFTFLDSLVKKSPRLKQKLVGIFIELGTSEGALIQQHLDKKNWKMIGYAVHKLKSNFRMMGLVQLLLKADEIEMISLQNVVDENYLKEAIPELLNRLEKAVENAKNILL